MGGTDSSGNVLGWCGGANVTEIQRESSRSASITYIMPHALCNLIRASFSQKSRAKPQDKRLVMFFGILPVETRAKHFHIWVLSA